MTVTLEQDVEEGKPLTPIGFALLLGTRSRRAVSTPSLTPSVSLDQSEALTTRLLLDPDVASGKAPPPLPAASTHAAAASAAEIDTSIFKMMFLFFVFFYLFFF